MEPRKKPKSKSKPSTATSSFFSQIPIGEDGALSFNSLPPETRMLILEELIPEDLRMLILINKDFYDLARDNVLWERKFQLHFPHVYEKETFKPKEVTDWFNQFWQTYGDEYANVKKPARRFFSLAKEGKLTEFKHTENYSPSNINNKIGEVVNDAVSTVFRQFIGVPYESVKEKMSSIKDKFISTVKDKFISLDDLASQADKSHRTILQWARLNDNQPLLDHVYKSIISPEYAGEFKEAKKLGKKQYSILHWAVEANQIEELRALIAYFIDKKASKKDKESTEKASLPDVDVRTAEDRTPLFLAAERGNLDMVKALVEMKANVNATDKNGLTVILMAAYGGNLEVVQYLVENKVNVFPKTLRSYTTLHAAAEGNAAAVAAYLIEKGLQVNARAAFQMTPLFSAAMMGNLEVTKVLIDAGASIDMSITHRKLSLENNFFKNIFKNNSAALKRLEAFLSKQSWAQGILVNLWEGTNPEITITPLQVAEIAGHEEVANYIRDAMTKSPSKKM